jgi:hypothetical protein
LKSTTAVVGWGSKIKPKRDDSGIIRKKKLSRYLSKIDNQTAGNGYFCLSRI